MNQSMDNNKPDAAPSGSSSLPPAISQEEFQSVVEMIGPDEPDLMVELIDTYLEESRILVETLLQPQREDNQEARLRAAHSLKSSSASLGALHLSRLCADLEAYLRGRIGELDEERQVQQIVAERERVVLALQAEKVRLQQS